MLGIVYNDVTRYLAPVYPTGMQRVVAYVKDLFSKKEIVMYDDTPNLWALECRGERSVKEVLSLLETVDPTIIRTTRKLQGWYAKVTKKQNFLKVADGHTVRYYSLTVSVGSLYDNTFFNVEKIISEVYQDRDDIHKKAKKKAA